MSQLNLIEQNCNIILHPGEFSAKISYYLYKLTIKMLTVTDNKLI